MPSATEWTLADLAMPALAAATVQEVLDLGRHGYEMSWRSGSWVGLKLHADIADGYATVDLGGPIPAIAPYERDGRRRAPTSTTGCRALVAVPPGGGDRRPAGGRGALRVRGRSRRRARRGAARIGILAAGKTYGDVVRAASDLGIELDDPPCGSGVEVVPVLAAPAD